MLLAGLAVDAWAGLWLIKLNAARLHDICKIDIPDAILCKRDTYDKRVALLSSWSHKAMALQELAGF